MGNASFSNSTVVGAISRYEEAQRLFNRLLTHCNDVGLLAEEFDLLNGRMLGNFKLTVTWGLINCALNLSREIGPTATCDERSNDERSLLALLGNA